MAEDQYEFDVMDAFINARNRGFCRRDICDEYFQNHKADRQKACCTRCGGVSVSSRLCCDACSPDAFMLLPLSQPPEKIRAKRRVNFKDSTMNAYDITLCNALRKWRNETLQRSGKSPNGFFGPNLILSDKLLIRIVMLARDRANKIPDIDALAHQTNWIHAKKYGAEILLYATCWYPPPAPPQPPLQGGTLANLVTSDVMAAGSSQVQPANEKRPRKCSACGSTSHNARNSVCPKHPSRKLPSADQENIPPAAASAPTTGKQKCGKCNNYGHNARNRRVCPMQQTSDANPSAAS
ncbi:hypothetical protein D9619_011145 [Psilocybe cf. subviscida]|uniref:Zinc knuckle domain-containing protein n=1 Tax=Psilocybe cf. subviscida TaxID=2480587 RepID=A0A8H5F5C3_9AGAR|nr:hypothetical protein D9619_011145 [Psilocybe cf. subviscida]